MSYADARAELKSVLEAVASVQTAYEHPPVTLAADDLPACLIQPPDMDPPKRIGGIRTKNYSVPVLVLVHDTDAQDAAATMDTVREDITDAFDAAVALNGKASHLTGPGISGTGGATFAGLDLVGFTATFGIEIQDARSFSK